MKVLITGATGFIGNAVAHRLAGQGHQVRCMVRENSTTQELSDIVWEKVVGDLTSLDSCREAVRGMEAVVHSAGMVTDFGRWETFEKVNVQGSLNIAEAACGNKVNRFVYLSTNDVLGNDDTRVLDDTTPPQKSGFPYPDTKLEAENLLFEMYRKRGLPLVALRPSWVYGPGDRTFIPEIVTAMRQGIMVYFWPKENPIWPVYIDNLVDAIELSLTKEEAVGRAYLVTDGVTITWEELCDRLAEGLALKPPKMSIPAGASKLLAAGLESTWGLARAKSRPLLTRYNIAFTGKKLQYDDSRIRQELGFTTKVLPDEGIARTVDWVRSHPDGAPKLK